MAKVSRKFKDISLSFVRNPVTGDVLAITNEDAIKKSVVNLVRTRVGERFYNNILGTKIDDSLFELQTPELASSLQIEIDNLLKNFEPRIANSSVLITYPKDSNELNVRISYNIVGLPTPPQSIDFVLQPTRV